MKVLRNTPVLSVASGMKIFMLSLICISSVACADGRNSPVPTVSSSGSGEVNAQPDEAMLSGDVVTEAPSADEAMTQVRKQLDKLIKKVLAQGIDSKDLQAAQVVVNPQWHYPRDKPRQLAGYQAKASFQIRLRQLDDLPSIYSVLADAGVTQLSPVSFQFSDRESLELKAIAKAVENARRKAQAGLTPLGQKVGDLQSLNINTQWQSPPIMRSSSKMMLSDSAMESAPAVNVGEQSVTATVQTEFHVR